MEETVNTEKLESENKSPDENQGGIRRRLRDRELLRKRKAEAQEKETNQWVFGMESEWRGRSAKERSNTRKRGRPRKGEPAMEISVPQEEKALVQEALAVPPLSETAEVIPAKAPEVLTSVLTVGSGKMESQAIIFESVQTAVLTTALTPAPAVDPVTDNPMGLVSGSAPVQSPTVLLDDNPAPAIAPFATLTPVVARLTVPNMAPVRGPFQDPLPSATFASSQVESQYDEMQSTEAFEPLSIEDLGSDEGEDITPIQDKKADDDDNTGQSEGPSPNESEQINMLSSLNASTVPPPLPPPPPATSQEY